MSVLENFEKEMETIGGRMVARADRELDDLRAELTPQFEALAAKVEEAYQEYEVTSNAILERLRNELDELGLLKHDDDKQPEVKPSETKAKASAPQI